MLQVIKSDSYGISAICFQCCFMIETQVLITVSDFSRVFFPRNHFLERGFNFQLWRGREGGVGLFLRWRTSVLMVEFSKKSQGRGERPLPQLQETLHGKDRRAKPKCMSNQKITGNIGLSFLLPKYDLLFSFSVYNISIKSFCKESFVVSGIFLNVV